MERGRRSRDCPNFLGTPIISRTGKATDFKFGGYIYRANPNKSPLKILQKRERGRIQGLPIFCVPLLSQERAKLRTSNFVGTFMGSIGTNADVIRIAERSGLSVHQFADDTQIYSSCRPHHVTLS